MNLYTASLNHEIILSNIEHHNELKKIGFAEKASF